MNLFQIAPVGLAGVAAAVAMAQETPQTPKEFGDVNWERRLEPALERAAASKKPVMLFFQEVPG